MKVDVLDPVCVSNHDRTVSGRALGGRRARIALTVLALARHPVPAERLADLIWADDRPTTWKPALRGVIQGLRSVAATIGAGPEELIVTTPNGYALARGVEVDVRRAELALADGARLLAAGRPVAAAAATGPATGVIGSALLPDEDAEWLTEQRAAIDSVRREALRLAAAAALQSGDHGLAVSTARRAVADAPMDEPGVRALIVALDRAGDRSGAVRAYEDCRALLADQLGIDPSADTVAAYLDALRSDIPGPRNRMPAPTTSFLGRVREQIELSEAVADPGFTTVVGTGGVGKSRLVRQVLTGLDERPVYWVALGPLTDDELVASSVALAVGATVGASDPADTIVSHLAPLGHVVLVLDGCEQVVDGAASLIAALISASPTLTVIATSRRPIGGESQKIFRLTPLAAPTSHRPGELARSDIVQLLVRRVREQGGEFTVDASTADLVAELCRRCAGLPLAVELVAAQLRAMSLPDLLEHLDQARVEEPDLLRAVLSRSYALLDEDEAVVFRRLAVLDGPIGLPLIRAVVSDADRPATRVVRILRELTDLGLLTIDRSGPRWRYQQDDDLHRYAAELLRAAGEEKAAFAALADAIGAILPADARAAPAGYREEITSSIDAVRSLLGAAVDGRGERDRGLEIAFRLHRYFASTDVAEGRFWLSRLLDGAAPDGPWTGRATFALGYLSYWSGDARAALPVLEMAVSLLRGHDDGFCARALVYLGGIADDVDRGPDAVAFVKESIEITERLGDADLHVAAVIGVGCILAERVRPEAAEYAATAIELCRSGVSAEQLAATLPTAAMICWQVGAVDQAASYLDEARPMLETKRIARIVLLSTAAGVALARGEVEAAVEHGRAADAEATELGVEREIPLIRAVLARALLATGDTPAAADRALASISAAVALSFEYPLAVGLEAAALVALVHPGTDRVAVARLLVGAQAIRIRGARPTAPSLQAAVDAATLELAPEMVALTDRITEPADLLALADRLLHA